MAIYLDYAATTPVDQHVLAAMQPWWADPGYFANPSSSHAWGNKAYHAVATAEQQVLSSLSTKIGQIIWTSGASEANQLALHGVAYAYQQMGRHIISIATEHKSVLEPLAQLAKQGWELTLLPVNKQGQIDLDQFGRALRSDTVLVSTMWQNNETGVNHPMAEISRLLRNHSAIWHVDAAQAVGKYPIDVDALQIDLLTISGHKMHAPKGIGALYLRRIPRIKLEPMLRGGGQQKGIRAGTLPVPLIVGIGSACAYWQQSWQADFAATRNLFYSWWRNLISDYPDIIIHAKSVLQQSQIISIAFPMILPDQLRKLWPELLLSFGSACQGRLIETSHVLSAMQVNPKLADRTVRVSIGLTTTKEDLDLAKKLIYSGLLSYLEGKP